MLVRFNHVARPIVNTNHSIVRAAIESCVADCLLPASGIHVVPPAPRACPAIVQSHVHVKKTTYGKLVERSYRSGRVRKTQRTDRNADKVLTALRHAPNGTTKTEISGEVFNQHAPSFEIDEALRLLHGLSKLGGYQYPTKNCKNVLPFPRKPSL
jgi:hypothetical protein